MTRRYPNTPLESWRNVTGIGQGGAWADGERYDYSYPYPPSSRRSSTATVTTYATAPSSRRTSAGSYYAAADGGERFNGGRALDGQRDMGRTRGGGLRADVAEFQPGRKEHWINGVRGNGRGIISEKGLR